MSASTPVNDAPVCLDVLLNTSMNNQGQTTPNCSDIDSTTLTYSITSQPAHGTGSVTSDLLTYMPSVDYSGADSFTYQATDGEANSNVANITVAGKRTQPRARLQRYFPDDR